MPDWIFWVAFGWLMFAVVGRRRVHAGCGSSRRHRRPSLERRNDRGDTLPRAELPPHRPSRDELEERLRARYVGGELSVEEYERELDRLYRRR